MTFMRATRVKQSFTLKFQRLLVLTRGENGRNLGHKKRICMKNFNFSIARGCTAGARSDLKYDILAIVSSSRENFAGCTLCMYVIYSPSHPAASSKMELGFSLVAL